MKKRPSKKTLSFYMVTAIILLIFPMNLFALYSAAKSQNTIISEKQTSMENIGKVYAAALEQRIQTVNNFILELEDSDKNLSDIHYQKEWDYYYISGMGLRNSLEDHMTIYKDAEAFFYYSEKQQHGMLVEDSAQLSREQLIEAIWADDEILKSKKWQIKEIHGTKWLFHVDHWKTVYIGAGIELSVLEKEIQDAIGGKTSSAQFEVIHGKEENAVKNRQEAEKNFEEKDFIVAEQKCNNGNLVLYMQMEKAEELDNLPLLQKAGYLFALIELLLIPVILLILHILVLKPMERLNRALKALKEQPDTRIEKSTITADFSNLYQSFNEMADELVELKIDNYEKTLAKQKMEFRNLQMQVKPHFLFNSFNLMYNLVEMNEYKSVQTILLYLSDYFRYINIGEGDFSLLADELSLIEKYLEMSKIRYPDIFEVEFDIEEKAKDAIVPQLMIHNFVENVIKHGLNLKKKNQIKLQVMIEDENLLVRILDNGVGMDEKQVENINKGIFVYADGKNHVGLKNSSRRLWYLYGERGKMQVNSVKDYGTEIVLRIPFQTKQMKGRSV